MANIEETVKQELELYEQRETELKTLEEQLQSSPEFAKFIETQKAFRELETNVWKNIEKSMIDNNIKSIKTDRFTLSIAQRTTFDIDADELPSKFFKRVPDTTKINSTFKLEGKAPRGCSPRYTQHLVKRIK